MIRYSLWRALEVIGVGGAVPTWSAFRLKPGGIDIEVAATNGIEAAAKAREQVPAAGPVWLYVCTCRRRATKSNPNGVLVAPPAEVSA